MVIIILRTLFVYRRSWLKFLFRVPVAQGLTLCTVTGHDRAFLVLQVSLRQVLEKYHIISFNNFTVSLFKIICYSTLREVKIEHDRAPLIIQDSALTGPFLTAGPSNLITVGYNCTVQRSTKIKPKSA
jgi:hypothetical protein